MQTHVQPLHGEVAAVGAVLAVEVDGEEAHFLEAQLLPELAAHEVVVEDDAGRVYGSPREREPTLEVPRQLVAGEELAAAGEAVGGEEEEGRLAVLHGAVNGVLVVHHQVLHVHVGLLQQGHSGQRRHEVHEARADGATVALGHHVVALHAVQVGERILEQHDIAVHVEQIHARPDDLVEKGDLPPDLLLELTSRLIGEGRGNRGIFTHRRHVHGELSSIQGLQVKWR